MKTIRIVNEPGANESLTKALNMALLRYNTAKTGIEAYYPVVISLKDSYGEILGGLAGSIWGSWLHISLLWIDEPLRGSGWGRKLVLEAERYASEHNCIGVHLETFSFQDQPFYERLGYSIFGALENRPPGHTLYFMTKRLVA